ncbi:MAG: hypothetical protein WB973_10435 [Thermoanaerobaculia bacterium]
MPNAILRLILFVSSYSPMLLILAIQYRHSHAAFISLIAVATLSVLALFAFLRIGKGMAPISVKLTDITSRDADVMSYIVTYLLPFLGTDLSDVEKAISLFILFVVIGAIYIHSSLIYVNPMLNLAGYHVFEVTDDNSNRRFLLTRRSFVARGSVLQTTMIGDYVLMER